MTDTIPNSYFSLKTQFENLGDALINMELIKIAAELGPVNVDLSRCPKEFQDTLGLESIPNVTIFNSTKSLLKALFQARREGKAVYWFLSPGGYFGELEMQEFVKRLPNFAVLALMKLLGVRICHVGVSYERLGKRHLGFLKLRQYLLAHHIIRDQRSFDYMTSRGVKADGTMPDLALNLFSTPIEQSEEQHRIALCFRGDQHDDQEQEVQDFLSWLNDHIATDVSFRMVVQVARDEQVMCRLAKYLEEAHGRKVDVVTCFDDLEACKAAYADCDMVIANRLHGILVGGSQNGHVLACVRGTENEKIRGLFQSLNLADQIVELDRPLDDVAETALQTARTTVFSGVNERAKLLDGMKRIMAPSET